jgi:hypothetical protein
MYHVERERERAIEGRRAKEGERERGSRRKKAEID